jgi:hypothetical protein
VVKSSCYFFFLQNGVTEDINLSYTEGQTYDNAGKWNNGTLGFVHATDLDSTAPNNRVFYKIIGQSLSARLCVLEGWG